MLVYVLEDGLEIAGMGNLMATTAKVRGLEGAVIDGAARDIEEVTRIGFPIYQPRRVSPATSVGRYVSVAKQIPVLCAGVLVRPGDYIVGDSDGVVVVPAGGGRAGGRTDRPVRRQREQDDPDHRAREIDAQGARDLQPVLTAVPSSL